MPPTRRSSCTRGRRWSRRPWTSTAGPWEPEPLADGGIGLLVIEGALLREVTAGDVGAMELLGPGDVLVPEADEAVADFVEAAVQWFALLPTQFAVLNAEVVQRLSSGPTSSPRWSGAWPSGPRARRWFRPSATTLGSMSASASCSGTWPSAGGA